MNQMPVSPSPFDKIIKEAGKVRTKGGFATMVSILLFLCFVFALVFSEGILKMILPITSLVFLVAFSTFAFINLKQQLEDDSGDRKGHK